MTFADILKKERVAAGKSQEKLSGLCGISRQAWSRYEAGEWKPKPDRLTAIANELGCSVDYLLGRTDERNFEHVKVP